MPNKENLGKTWLGFYADGLVEHDRMIVDLLDFVDEQGLTENTVVLYITDNGLPVSEFRHHSFSW